MARLWRMRPREVAEWTGREMAAALEAVEDVRPLEDWLHLALADLVGKGTDTPIADILRRWGWGIPEAPPAPDEAWLAWASKHGAEQSNG